MKKLRLLVTDECDRTCSGCCNKDWDLEKLPIVQSFNGYDEILLTGGEPMLYPDEIYEIIDGIKVENSTAKIYLYSAKFNPALIYLLHISYLDGLTFTLHDSDDIRLFNLLNDQLLKLSLTNKSLKLNVFKGVNVSGINLSLWTVKDNITWIKNCPLPVDEVFMRLEHP